jgi:hypothetical protein
MVSYSNENRLGVFIVRLFNISNFLVLSIILQDHKSPPPALRHHPTLCADGSCLGCNKRWVPTGISNTTRDPPITGTACPNLPGARPTLARVGRARVIPGTGLPMPGPIYQATNVVCKERKPIYEPTNLEIDMRNAPYTFEGHSHASRS